MSIVHIGALSCRLGGVFSVPSFWLSFSQRNRKVKGKPPKITINRETRDLCTHILAVSIGAEKDKFLAQLQKASDSGCFAAFSPLYLEGGLSYCTFPVALDTE